MAVPVTDSQGADRSEGNRADTVKQGRVGVFLDERALRELEEDGIPRRASDPMWSQQSSCAAQDSDMMPPGIPI